jgi:putative methylase
MRRSELILRLEGIPPPPHPRAEREQVVTPAEAAAELLETAHAAGDLAGRTVLDLGSGTGRLALGAAWLGAERVVGVEIDPESVAIAQEHVSDAPVEFVTADVTAWDTAADTVVMNPPFGAQRAHADRPFWDVAFRSARHSVYGFALENSRTFIARRAVAAGVHVVATRPVPWEVPRTFPHHTRRRVPIRVDLWVIGANPRT